jgi:hypothetical protein
VLLQQLGHDIVFLLQFGFEMLDFLILGVFLSFDIMAVWLAFKDNGTFFEERLLPLFDIAVLPFEKPLNSSTRFCTLLQIRQNKMTTSKRP